MDQNNGGCGWCQSALRGKLLRNLFWVLAVLGFVFAVGAGIESARYASEKREAVKYAKAGYLVKPTADSFRILPRMIYRKIEAEPAKQVVKIFGSILKVEGNKITILNNAAETQVVVSTADTHIFLGETEVGISSLKEGKDGLFTGVKNKEYQLEAKVIELR